VPRSLAAAVRAEIKTDLEAAVRISLIDLIVALDPNFALRISAAGMDDAPGAALTSLGLLKPPSMPMPANGIFEAVVTPEQSLSTTKVGQPKTPSSRARSVSESQKLLNALAAREIEDALWSVSNLAKARCRTTSWWFIRLDRWCNMVNRPFGHTGLGHSFAQRRADRTGP
jgi:hypothetical protein